VFRIPLAGEPPENPQAGWSGGFDVVIGNPPWERVKLQEKEWFAPWQPEIATAPSSAKRKAMIDELAIHNPELYRDWIAALRQASGEARLLRSSGRYPLCGRGDVNTYAVFAELMRALTHSTGRTGALVPSGIATDDTTKFFFADLVLQRSLVSLFDFENAVGLFAGVGHGRFKFSILTMSGYARPVEEADFFFFAHHVTDLADPHRHFRLTPAEIELLNPNTRTCPVFRSARDADLVSDIYRRVPVLIDERLDEDGNSWSLSFLRMFDMSNDSNTFLTREDLQARGWVLDGNVFCRDADQYLPLYEAKMVHQFTHRWGDYGLRAPGSQDSELPRMAESVLSDPNYLPLPHYWVSKTQVNTRLVGRWSYDWLIGWRDVCRNTDERTVIASVLPRTAVGHKFPLLLPGCTPLEIACLLGNLDSFILDYTARQKLGGTSLTYFVLKQLPVLPPREFAGRAPWDPHQTLAEWIGSRTCSLVFTAHDLTGFARDLGWLGPPTRWDPAGRALVRAELDAAFFHLYGVARESVDYVLDCFPIARRNDERRFGTYRTKELVLEAFDRLAEAMSATRTSTG